MLGKGLQSGRGIIGQDIQPRNDKRTLGSRKPVADQFEFLARGRNRTGGCAAAAIGH